MFIYIFRLLCVYFLVNPPRGGNVNGGELLEPLMKCKNVQNENKKQDDWLENMDKMIDTGIIIDDGEEVFEETETKDFSENLTDDQDEHNYDVVKTCPEVIAHMAGYICFKMHRFTCCADCRKSMMTTDIKNIEENDNFKYIKLIDKGSLCYLSKNLFSLITKIEETILAVVGRKSMKLDTLIMVFEEVGKLNNIHLIGCKEHAKHLSKKIIQFFVTIRGEFIAKSYNFNRDERKKL